MKELYKPYGMIPVPIGNEISDFFGRWICTASDDKEIKNYIGGFPKWCTLPSDTRRQPSAEQRIEKMIEELEKERDNAGGTMDPDYFRGLELAISLLRGERE